MIFYLTFCLDFAVSMVIFTGRGGTGDMVRSLSPDVAFVFNLYMREGGREGGREISMKGFHY